MEETFDEFLLDCTVWQTGSQLAGSLCQTFVTVGLAWSDVMGTAIASVWIALIKEELEAFGFTCEEESIFPWLCVIRETGIEWNG